MVDVGFASSVIDIPAGDLIQIHRPDGFKCPPTNDEMPGLNVQSIQGKRFEAQRCDQ
jgi:hypothetical protein